MEEKKILIMQSLISLISKKQTDDFSIEEVAESAGIGKGTVYLYFKSKQELLYNSILFSVSTMFKKTRIEVDKEEKFCEKINKLFYSFIDLNEKTFLLWENYLSKIDRSYNSDKSKTEQWMKIKKDFIDYIIDILSDGVKQNYIKDVESLEIFAEIVYAQLRGLLIEIVFKGSFKKDKKKKDLLIKKSIEVITNGITSNNIDSCIV